MQTLLYRCPYCQKEVEVSPERVQEPVICPNEECGRPFQPELPQAKLVGVRSADGSIRAARSSATSSDEQTLKSVHPALARGNPLRFVGCGLLLALGMVGVAFWATTGNPTAGAGGLALFLLGGGMLLLWWLSVLNVTLTITNERSILRKGIFDKSTTEVRHSDVRNLQVDQQFTQRLLGVGNLAISSAGQDELEIQVRGIPHPDRIADLIRDLQ